MKEVQTLLDKAKEFLMEEHDSVHEWKVKDVEKTSHFAVAKRARAGVVEALKKMKMERNEFGRLLSHEGTNLSARMRDVAKVRVDLRGLTEVVQRAVTHSFEGLEKLDGSGEFKKEDVIDLVVNSPLLSPNSSDQPLQPTTPPKRRTRARASTSGTAKNGPVTKKARVE